MIRCCIFDLDGTLLNTLKALTLTVNLTLEHFGYEPVDEDHVRQFVGDGYKLLMERVLRYRGDEQLEHYEESLKVYLELFAVHSMDRKPDPAGVKLILDRFGVKPEECLYFGDTNTDMKTGLGAGLQTVGVTWGFRDREELESFHPQHIISHPDEVFGQILEKKA